MKYLTICYSLHLQTCCQDEVLNNMLQPTSTDVLSKWSTLQYVTGYIYRRMIRMKYLTICYSLYRQTYCQDEVLNNMLQPTSTCVLSKWSTLQYVTGYIYRRVVKMKYLTICYSLHLQTCCQDEVLNNMLQPTSTDVLSKWSTKWYVTACL